MSGDIESLIRDLLRLSPEDRRKVIDRVETFTPSGEVRSDDLLYEALRDYGLRTGIPVPPIRALLRSRGMKRKLREASQVFVRLIKEELVLTTDLDVRRAHEILVELIANRMRATSRKPVDCWRICDHLPNAEAYLHRAFPGYKELGALPFVGQRMMGRR